MTLAGFSAETSLYETRLHYRSTGASVQANGVMLQQLHGQLHGPPGTCGPCVYDDERGYCVRKCTAFGYPYIATCNCPGGGGGRHRSRWTRKRSAPDVERRGVSGRLNRDYRMRKPALPENS